MSCSRNPGISNAINLPNVVSLVNATINGSIINAYSSGAIINAEDMRGKQEEGWQILLKRIKQEAVVAAQD